MIYFEIDHLALISLSKMKRIKLKRRKLNLRRKQNKKGQVIII